MNTSHRLVLLASSLALVGSGIGSPPLAQAQSSVGYEVVVSIPISTDGIGYSSPPSQDVLVWGPSSLTVDEAGGYWIGTGVSKQVFHVGPDGKDIEPISLGDQTQGLDDIAITPSGIWTLDTASSEQQIRLFDFSGKLVTPSSLPDTLTRASGVTGLEYDSISGQVSLTGGADYSAVVVDAQGKTLAPQPKNQRSFGSIDVSVTFDAARNGAGFPQSASIATPTVDLKIEVERALVGVEILAASEKLGLFVVVSEMDPNSGVIQVDEVVRHYDLKSGLLVGVARIPLAERYTYVEHGVAVAPDGDVYALIPRVDRIDIARLEFAKEIKPILVRPILLPATNQGRTPLSDGALACSISRDTIVANAAAYYNNYINLTAQNINGSCNLRTKPRYLFNPGPYTSVPYDWGGGDSIAQFNSLMAQNLQAGDIELSPYGEFCSRGVDCSGFMTNIWGMTNGHLGTGQLPDISTSVALAELQRGDLFNKVNVHSAMFKEATWSGLVTVYESTTYNNVDRVFTGSYNWSRFNGYLTWKYKNVCP